MDGQNFENENNVTVDTTATEVSSTAEPAQEIPAWSTDCLDFIVPAAAEPER